MHLANQFQRFTVVMGCLVVALCVVVGLIAGRAFRSEYVCYRPFRKEAPTEKARVLFSRVEDVTWSVGPSSIRGWFIAGTNGASIVLVHGTGATRADTLEESEIFNRAGFNVLTFDWPGHGESDGQADWGAVCQQALKGALDWLARRPGIDMERVGAWGVSMGTMPLLSLAVEESRLKAVALAGAFADLRDQLGWEYRALGGIGKWPAIGAAALRGTPVGEPLPRDRIGRLSPRPVLIILGEDDQLVLPEMSRQLYEKARQPKQLLALHNVGHGEYSGAGGAYSEPLVAFFEHYLNQSRVGGSR